MRNTLLSFALICMAIAPIDQDGKVNDKQVTLTSTGYMVTSVGDTFRAEIIKVRPTTATSGAISVNLSDISAVTITPTGACTFSATGGVAGRRVTFSILTSGTTPRTLTWGTNFKVTGTLVTGGVSGKYFSISFICRDGTLWVETGRTAAM